MSVPELSAEMQQRLREEDAAPSYGNVKNPIDLGAASPKWPDWYLKSTKMLAKSGEVDAVVVILTGVITEWVAPRFAEAKNELIASGVPIIVMGLWKQKDMLSLRLTYHAANLPVVEEPVEVVECLRALAQRGGVSLSG
jgi:acyl-CoA synthetase (NDP forming)